MKLLNHEQTMKIAAGNCEMAELFLIIEANKLDLDAIFVKLESSKSLKMSDFAQAILNSESLKNSAILGKGTDMWCP